MRSFNATFTTEKNKRSPDGPAPRNLLEFGFATPVKLSDADVNGAAFWDGINKIANGDMELNSVWLDDGVFVTTNERSDEQAHSGTYSRKLVVGHGLSGIKNTADRFTTVTGTTYRHTFRVYRFPFVDTPIHITVRNGADTADVVSTSSVVIEGIWALITVEYLETEGGDQAYIVLSAENGTTTYFDDAVVEGSTLEPQYDGENIVPNGDMELESVWISDGSHVTTNERSTAQVYAGTYSRKVTTDAGYFGIRNSGPSDKISLTAGEQYRFRIRVYQESGTETFQAWLLDGGTTFFNKSFSTSIGSWTYYEWEFTASMTTSNAQLLLRVTSAATVYIDEAIIEGTSLLPVFDGINLLPNGDMELDSGWADDGAYITTNERSSAWKYKGTYSRKLVVAALAAGISGIKNSSNRFTTATGTTYRKGIWVYRPAGGSSSPVKIVIRNGADTGDIVSQFTAPTVGAWKYISHEYTENAGGSKAFISIRADADTITYIDDAEIETEVYPLEYKGLVKSWGFIDSSAGQTVGRSIVGRIEVPDLQLVVINSQNPRFSDNSTTADPLEGVVVTLYQWFKDTDLSKKEVIFVGVVRGQPYHDELECRLTVKGIWHKYNRVIGSDQLVTTATAPNADPDDIGRMANICYGALDQVPCLAVESGAVDILLDDITAGQTTIELSWANEFPANGVIGLDNERISYTGKSDNTLTGCTRGYDGTTAVTHQKGSPCWEERSLFVYLVAGHPVKLIGDVYVDKLRVTSVATKYTGQPGDELTGWPGQAVVTVPTRLTRQQVIDLMADPNLDINPGTLAATNGDLTPGGTWSIADTGVTVNDILVSQDDYTVDKGDMGATDLNTMDAGSHNHGSTNFRHVWNFDRGSSTGTMDVADSAIRYMIDGDFFIGAALYSINQQVHFTKEFYEAPGGTPYKYQICMALGDMPSAGSVSLSFGGKSITATNANANTTKRSTWQTCGSTIDTWAKVNEVYAELDVNYSMAGQEVMQVWIEFEVAPEAPVSAADGIKKVSLPTLFGDVETEGWLTAEGGDGSLSNVIDSEPSLTGVVGLTGEDGMFISGSVTLIGNSVADVEIGKLVTAEVDGWQDDASGTITGTPNGLIERPGHVVTHLLTHYCDFPTANLGSSFADSGSYYVTNGYTFDLLINQPISADVLLMRLALQSRSRFLVTPAGEAQLIVRQLNQASTHAIPKAEIKQGSMAIRRSAEDDLVNTFNILFDRDWRLTGPDAYQGATAFADATSIGRYGARELAGAELMYFDAVKDSAMVAHVGAYWLSFLKDSRKLPSFAVFLDNMEIEPGDIIDLTHDLDNMAGFVGEVLKVRHVPGSAKSKRIDHLQITAIENKLLN